MANSMDKMQIDDNLNFLNQKLSEVQASLSSKSESAQTSEEKTKVAAYVLLSSLKTKASTEPGEVAKFISENRAVLNGLTGSTSATNDNNVSVNSSQTQTMDGPQLQATKVGFSNTAPGLLNMAGDIKNKIAMAEKLAKQVEEKFGSTILTDTINNVKGTVAGGLKSVLGDSFGSMAMSAFGITNNVLPKASSGAAAPSGSTSSPANSPASTGGKNILSDLFSAFMGSGDKTKEGHSMTETKKENFASQGDTVNPNIMNSNRKHDDQDGMIV